MPEWAEVRLMTEYFNRHVSGKRVIDVQKSTDSKVKFEMPKGGPITSIFPEKCGKEPPLPATVYAKSRGKETFISFTVSLGKRKVGWTWHVLINYGMSGSWRLSSERWSKHARLSLALDDGTFMEFIDPRKFGRFTWLSLVTPRAVRGPDPVDEPRHFIKCLLMSKGHRQLTKPICEVLLNQRWFNGVGNYLRSTILHDMEVDPFKPFCDLTNDEILELACRVRGWCLKAFEHGGGELYTWKNAEPRNDGKKLSDIIYYRKGLACKDSTNRTFWFDPKWEKSCPYPIIDRR